MASVKAVLFDLDNTLIDFLRMKREAVSASVESMVASGLGMPREQAEKQLLELYWEKGIENPLIFQEFLTKVLGKVDYRILAKAVMAYRSRKADYAKPLPGVIPLLKTLIAKGLKIGIVSDAPAINAWIRLVQMGMDDLFDVVVTLDDTGERKPSRRPFELALQRLGLQPKSVLFVGDMPDRDIAGARELGMRTAFARYGNRSFSGKSGADWDLEDVRELAGIIT